MGVDYSSSIGYGIAIKGDEYAPKILDRLRADERTDDWLIEGGFDLIGYDCCGDQMSGPEIHFFYVKGTELLDADHYDLDGVYEFNDEVDTFAKDQLLELADLFSYQGKVGWKLIANVS